MTESGISPEDLDSTTAALREGAPSVPLDQAISEVDGWQNKLSDSGDPGLQPIADNLGELKGLLLAETIDVEAVGRILVELGERTQGVAVSGSASPVADRLQLLSTMLTADGRNLLEDRGETPEGRT